MVHTVKVVTWTSFEVVGANCQSCRGDVEGGESIDGSEVESIVYMVKWVREHCSKRGRGWNLGISFTFRGRVRAQLKATMHAKCTQMNLACRWVGASKCTDLNWDSPSSHLHCVRNPFKGDNTVQTSSRSQGHFQSRTTTLNFAEDFREVRVGIMFAHRVDPLKSNAPASFNGHEVKS